MEYCPVVLIWTDHGFGIGRASIVRPSRRVRTPFLHAETMRALRPMFAFLLLLVCSVVAPTGASAQQTDGAAETQPRTVYLAPSAGPAATRSAEAFDAAMLAVLARRLEATGAHRALTWDHLLSLKPAHVALAPRHTADPCLVGLQLASLAESTVDVRWCGVTTEVAPGRFRLSGILQRMRDPPGERRVDAPSVTDSEEAAAMIFERLVAWDD